LLFEYKTCKLQSEISRKTEDRRPETGDGINSLTPALPSGASAKDGRL